MTKLRNQKIILFALLVLLAAFAGCKGESPTAPDPTPGGGGGIPGGGTTPPVGATVTLTVSSATPLAASTSTVTATVASNGQPVPNGTAVEFSTNFGSFSLADPNLTSIIRTTTNGVATVTLTAPTPGPAIVTAVVNNVSARTTITFQAQQVPPITPSTSPTITSITPGFGRPAGGETITINGTNFRAPARVIFDFGSGVTKDAFVVSVSPTQIVALTPPIDVSTAQQRQATITVIVDAATPNEQKVTSAANAFTFQAEVLTPTIAAVSPSSGDVTGGTRVTIFGSGFQAPVQVQFSLPNVASWQDLQVISVNFNQIVAITPPGRDVSTSGDTPVTGTVDLKVTNVNSAKNVVALGAFRYTPGIQITALGPTEGRYDRQTRITIDGTGFIAPVAVSVAGFAAQPIAVSNSQIIALVGPISPPGCGDVPGEVAVTNIDNGDSDTGPNFIFRVPKPIVTNITSASIGPIQPGSTIAVTVQNAGASPSLQIGGNTVFVTAATPNPDGSTTLQATVPANITLGTMACPGGGTVPITTSFPITFTSGATTCSTTLTGALTVQPPNIGKIFLIPNPLNLTATAAVPPAGMPPTGGSPAVNGSGSFSIVNNGAAPLTITSITGGDATIFATPPPLPQTLGPCDVMIVSVDYVAQGPGQTHSVTFAINATSNSTPLTANETVIGRTQ
jgi:hypothetical protein